MTDTSTDWIARLTEDVYTYFRASNWAVPLAQLLGARANANQALVAALLYLFSIDPITDDPTSPAYGIGRGVQLDRIGALIGTQRSGLTDGPYRALLRAKIRVNKSNGSPNQIIAVFVAMFAGVGAPIYTPGWVAEYTLRLEGVVIPVLEIPIAAMLLGEATQAGTYAVLEYATTAPSQTLICNATGPQQGWGNLSDLTVGGALGGATAGVV